MKIWFQNRRYKCKRQKQDRSLELAGAPSSSSSALGVVTPSSVAAAVAAHAAVNGSSPRRVAVPVRIRVFFCLRSFHEVCFFYWVLKIYLLISSPNSAYVYFIFFIEFNSYLTPRFWYAMANPVPLDSPRHTNPPSLAPLQLASTLPLCIREANMGPNWPIATPRLAPRPCMDLITMDHKWGTLGHTSHKHCCMLVIQRLHLLLWITIIILD